MANNKNIKVEVPLELAEYVMQQSEYCGRYIKKRTKGNSTHYAAKLFGFYLLLKAESGTSGWILDYTHQVSSLSQSFCISPRTFFTYINQLEKLQLAERIKGTNRIRLAGWDQLGKLLDIDTKKRETIHFEYEGKQKIHWWFAAIEIMCNQKEQAYMIWKRVNKNSEIKNSILTALISRGFDTTKSNDLEYFSNRLFMLYVEDFKSGTEVHDILIMIRSDVNRSCKTIGKAWAMSPQLTAYWKARMRTQRIIDISKITITSQWTRETNRCHKNKYCHVIWDDKQKERVWFLCDQITVLMPWKWEEILTILAAA